MQLSVRDVDEKIFKNFKTQVVEDGLKVGDAVTMALDQWVESRKKTMKNFLDLKPVSWGKGTEKSSKEIDKILYGD